jgi:hypothetical protein
VQAADVPIVLYDPHSGVETELSLAESADARARYPAIDHAARKYRGMFGPGRLFVSDHAIFYEVLEPTNCFTVARW